MNRCSIPRPAADRRPWRPPAGLVTELAVEPLASVAVGQPLPSTTLPLSFEKGGWPEGGAPDRLPPPAQFAVQLKRDMGPNVGALCVCRNEPSAGVHVPNCLRAFRPCGPAR
jgi:hypothetical protein